MTPERRSFFARAAPPLLIGALIVMMPVPEGLKPQAWYYFALFAAVIVGVATEPIPPGAVGLAGVFGWGLENQSGKGRNGVAELCGRGRMTEVTGGQQ